MTQHQTVTAESKVCTNCNLTKPLSEFEIDKRRKDGKGSRCKVCYAANKRSRRSAQPAYYKRQQIKNKYGLDPETYDAMLASTSHCPICEKVKPLVVDHSHDTGNVRGLICRECNLGLGNFFDNLKALSNAITYLQNEPLSKTI